MSSHEPTPQDTPQDPPPKQTITTLIFDVDDTLYDVHTNFTQHRNGSAVHQFMVERLGFADHQSAKEVRDRYFERYHSTAKALTVAEAEGAFPPLATTPPPPQQQQQKTPRFDPKDLATYWKHSLDYSLLGGPKPQLRDDLLQLQANNLNVIAFSNGPRDYVVQVLTELGLFPTVFTAETVFAVDDVLPYCKPEAEAFERIFDRLGAVVQPSHCVMVEDSMKNIRTCKALGMHTILITGSTNNDNDKNRGTDAPDPTHPSVDVALPVIEQLRVALPGLWQSPPVLFLP